MFVIVWEDHTVMDSYTGPFMTAEQADVWAKDYRLKNGPYGYSIWHMVNPAD